MAEHAASSAEYHHGDMPIVEHAETYSGVMGMFKWGALAVADLLILLTLWYCTPVSYFAGLVVVAIVTIIAVVALRRRKSAH